MWWEAGANVVGKTFDEIKSKRRFGVELEIGTCSKRELLRPPQSCWGTKQEGTGGVHTEFYSPILQGDEGLAQVRLFCNIGKEFVINEGCGYHLHLDCSKMSDQELKRCALAYLLTYDAWTLFVTNKRKGNKFTLKDQTPIKNLDSDKPITEIMGVDGERYRWANWCSYKKHKTLEIRLHAGTKHSAKIINWIKAHVWLMDWASKNDMSAIKDHFGFKVEEFEVKVANNELHCKCDECVQKTGFVVNKEFKEIMPTPEKCFIGLAKIWKEFDGGEIASFYLGLIKKHLNSGGDRKFDFELAQDELKIPIAAIA